MAGLKREHGAAEELFCKILRLDGSYKTLFQNDEKIRGRIIGAMRSLYAHQMYTMCVVQLGSCNAACKQGCSFSQASCDISYSKEKIYPIGTIFNKGIGVLDDYLLGNFKDDILDNSMVYRFLCEKLQECISDERLQFILDLMTDEMEPKTQTQITFALAEHLLSKLSLSEAYIVDKRSKKTGDSKKCFCGGKNDFSKLGDTSIGNSSVWHGNLDVIVGRGDCEVAVYVPALEISPGSKSPVEMKNLKDKIVQNQMIAETIVFSFLQKKRRSSLNHFLIPNIGITPSEVVFYFFDSDHDVLIQSATMPLLSEGKLCYPTVLILWLVLNYKYLGDGLTGELKQLPKSHFFTLVKETLNVYKEDLTIGNVLGVRPETFEPSAHEPSKFYFPDVQKREILAKTKPQALFD